MQYIDTHTHIYSEEFDADRDEVVHRAMANGATHLLLANTDESSIAPIRQMCLKYPGFCLPMIGLHPTELPDNPHQALDRMEQLLDASDFTYTAIGEIGMDLYWDTQRLEEQQSVFQRQLEWAAHYDLPISIHMRSAHHEVVEAMRPYRNRLHGGVFHCFGGTAEEAQELLALFPEFAFGIGGVLTFKKSSLPATLKTTLPIEQIVIETDAPYLTPTPYRGKRNEPSYLPFVVAKLADIYNITPEEAGEITCKNAKRIFRIQEKAL